MADTLQLVIRRRNVFVHRLVAEAFCSERSRATGRHKDGDKTNNACNNLEWVDRSANLIHAARVYSGIANRAPRSGGSLALNAMR